MNPHMFNDVPDGEKFIEHKEMQAMPTLKNREVQTEISLFDEKYDLLMFS